MLHVANQFEFWIKLRVQHLLFFPLQNVSTKERQAQQREANPAVTIFFAISRSIYSSEPIDL